jgi:hypothetical protein
LLAEGVSKEEERSVENFEGKGCNDREGKAATKNLDKISEALIDNASYF